MASTIRDYSATAASNTAVDGADISEGCSPAGINDAIRGVMADLKDVSTGAVSLESPAADSLSLTGALTTTSTIDGRDVAADGTKLDGIAAGATAGSDVVQDTTPQLGGSLDVNGQDIVSTSNGNIDLDPNGSGKVVFKGNATKGSGQFVLNCEQNSHGIVIKGPPHSANASYTLTLPNNDGSASEFLQTDGSGNLSWGAGATAYTDSNVDTHLNTGTASASEVLSWTGSDYDWVASGGGGADLYAANESSPAAQPSATGGNAIAIGDSAISSGDDAISLGISRAGGLNSFAAVNNQNSTSYGAGGSHTIAVGYNAKALSNYSVALGSVSNANLRCAALGPNSTAGGTSGTESTAVGYQTYAGGSNNTVIGSGSSTRTILYSDVANSSAIGHAAIAFRSGQISFGSGNIDNEADGQYSITTLRCKTTNNTQTVMTTDNSTATALNQINLRNRTVMSFKGMVVARESEASGTDCAAWEISGLIRQESGGASTTVLVNSAITVIDNQPNWGLALSADTTLGGLKVQITGASSTTIKWAAPIQCAEVNIP